MFITGVIGYPLKLTYSPILHNTAFKKLNIKGIYYPMCVLQDDFGKIINLLKKLNFVGVNITNPYKMEVLKYLDELDPLSSFIGAVNTITIKENKLIGRNTDIYGFSQSLKENKIEIKNKNILLIGAGGVSRACAYVLKRQKPKKIFIANKTLSKAQKIRRICDAEIISLNQISDVIKDINVAINATSADLQNMIVSELPMGSFYYDTNYRFKSVRRKGIFLISGLGMLIHQAAYSFSLWTKEKPPVGMMKETLKGVLND